MVQEGHCFRRRHPRALPGNLRGGRRRKAFRLGADRRRRAGARRSCSINSRATCSAATPRTYAADPLARAVADAGDCARLRPQVPIADWQFFYLPFEHSEALADQERCCALVAATGDADLLKWAELHADIIRRFGRFPHRNAMLGRATTPRSRLFSTAAASRVRPKSAARALDVPAKPALNSLQRSASRRLFMSLSGSKVFAVAC